MRWLLFFSLFTFTLVAQNAPATELRWQFDFGDQAILRPKLKNESETALFNQAFALLQQFPPPRVLNPFRMPVGNKKRVILLSVIEGDDIVKNFADDFFKNGVTARTFPDQTDVVVFIHVEKIVYDAKGNLSPDALPNLLLTLAHEIYGNVGYFLSHDLDENLPLPKDIRQRQEIRTFKIGLTFAKNFCTTQVFADWSADWKAAFNRSIEEDEKIYQKLRQSLK